MNDDYYMSRAITLAARAQGRTSPNPMVGAVLVKRNRIVAEDYHRRAGTPHAEALVLSRAAANAAASTLYVSLEPCCHTDKRTPPCTKSIIRAGVRRVVIAMNDPNPKVSGKGIRELRQAGITVVSGILEDRAARLNESYVKYITTGKPFVTLKVAMTLDGKIATPAGQSKWITGEKARLAVHRLRSRVDAVLTAIGTVKADDPELTARIRGGRNPGRVVIDPGLEIPLHSRLLRVPPDTILAAMKGADEAKKSALTSMGVSIIEFDGEIIDLDDLARRLGEMGITSLMIEGGSSLNSRALDSGIVDKVIFFVAPMLIGGRESYPAVGGKTFRRLEEAYALRDVKVRRLGPDIYVEGYL